MKHSIPMALVVLEGRHDVAFLRSASALLHTWQPAIPDLAALERQNKIALLASGGACSPDFAQQLVRLGCAQFHLLDRDVAPETAHRQQTALAINALPRCVARLTTKRSLENYLHPLAIAEARGLEITIDDLTDVASTIAQHELQVRHPESDWCALSHRTRKRMRNRVKSWLNTEAAARMTPERLQQRDPDGEVIGWLMTIGKLVQTD